MQIKYNVYAAGHSRHPERTTISGGTYAPVTFPALCFVLQHPTEGVILFDTGFSFAFENNCHHFPEFLYNTLIPMHIKEQDNLAAQIKRHASINAEDVRHIILSHFHVDHIAGVCDFPNARIICSKDGYEAVSHLGKVSSLFHGFFPKLLPSEFLKRTDFIEEKPHIPLLNKIPPFEIGHDLFGDGSILAVPLPGHAKGQYGLLFEDTEGKSVFLVADACWSSRAYREYKLPHIITRLVHDNWKSYQSTLYGLHQLHQLRKDIYIIPSHCREIPHEH